MPSSVSAGWRSGGPCGKLGCPPRLGAGRPPFRGPPIPKFGPRPRAASEQPGFREVQVTLRAEDQVVVPRNVEEAPGVDELAGEGAVVCARRGVADGWLWATMMPAVP